MDGQSQETLETQESQTSVDPWEAAFAAVNGEGDQNAESSVEASEGEQQQDSGAAGDDASANPDPDETGNGIDASGMLGGQVDTGEQAGAADEGSSGLDFGVSSEQIEEYRKAATDRATNAAIEAVSKAFIDKGIRHTNGRLGASVNDPDICKRDDDGIPHFYNPDTGREFTGDNPRKQAQEWVDDYNAELRTSFNESCKQYAGKLLEQEAPQIAVLEFSPTYESLDPVRRGMLDSIIEDYEIKDDNGEVIGYSCDLNKALSVVNRQVKKIQGYGNSNPIQAAQGADAKPSGPALDMKSSAAASSGSNEPPEFKSIEEAMLYKQNQILADLHAKDKK